jgi:hypothetical protein
MTITANLIRRASRWLPNAARTAYFISVWRQIVPPAGFLESRYLSRRRQALYVDQRPGDYCWRARVVWFVGRRRLEVAPVWRLTIDRAQADALSFVIDGAWPS